MENEARVAPRIAAPGNVAPGMAALGMAALLCGCGFRLAGSDPLPRVLARPYLELKDPYTDFSREFEHQLKSAGALLQTVREGATAGIEISRDQVGQRTLSVSATNIPTEYELTYSVTFEVTQAGKQLLAAQTVSLSKDYSFDEHFQLAKEHEADILRQQMARDLVANIMHRLAKLK